jgi:hypothetical protein
MPILETPSGLTAEVRKIRGVELVRLAEQADDEAETSAFGQVLGACWIRTIDPGPYPFVKADSEERPPWPRILKGDVLFAFVYLRRISMPDGNSYDFDVRCEECRKRYGWTIDLAKDLKVKPLPPESVERIKAGEAFETCMHDGRRIRFALQTTDQEAPMLRLMKQQKRTRTTFVDVLASQTISIEGVNPDLRARWRFLSELDLDELYGLREAFEAPDCGLDTAIQTRCTKAACSWVQDVNLPLGKTFFAPRRKPKTDEAGTPSSSGDYSEGSIESGSGNFSTTYSGPNTGGADTI